MGEQYKNAANHAVEQYAHELRSEMVYMGMHDAKRHARTKIIRDLLDDVQEDPDVKDSLKILLELLI